MILQLKTGKAINVSTFDWLFVIKEDEIEEFFESCVADDLGIEINNPFSSTGMTGRIQAEDYDNLDEIPDPEADNFQDIK